MNNLSRRQLASYATDQLLDNKRVSTVAKQLAAVLVTSKRQNQAELLASDIAWELEYRGKVANAQVITAHDLSQELKKHITAHVKKAAKVEHVIISEQVDKSVIGGVRIDTAAHSWDKTLSRKLTDIREVI
ncbi:F0F1 ATP synthase subunit delta [Candidatus Saccharibacteria bacterium]|nr:F0F1 ATP synthase subunit delta [Candidatus Saccharibacteria bacterium]